MISLTGRTIRETHDALKRGDFSVSELVAEYQKNIKAKNKELNAYLEVFADIAAQVKASEKKFKDGTATPLTGIPFAIKDNMLIDGRVASAGSKMLENYTATYDATAVSKLKKEGAIFLGRTNMDEFALGGSTENSAFGVTKNPHDLSRVAGGTSGGSAAAVAADLALAALGSDTGGSVRNPASFCGVVGLKPTYGAVSRSGLIAAVSSFDQIGPIANSVEDAEIVFNAIKGKDRLDSTSRDVPVANRPQAARRIAAPKEFFTKGDVQKNFETTLKKLEAAGYEIVKDIKLPSIASALAAYYIINFAEVSSNLARFDGVRYGLHKDGKDLLGDYLESRSAGFGAEAKRRIMLGTYVLSSGYYDAYYAKALSARAQLTQEFEKAFEKVDAILMPTMPTPAFKIGEKSDPVSLYLEDICTVPANLTGLPAISVPNGFVEIDGKRLPVGIQIMAPHFQESTLFSVGKDIERMLK